MKLSELITYYHSTPSDNLANIAKIGLRPSKDPYWKGMNNELYEHSKHKVCVTPSPRLALFYGLNRMCDALKGPNAKDAPIPVILRINAPNQFQHENGYDSELYTTRAIKPQYIELFDGKNWVNIRKAATNAQTVQVGSGYEEMHKIMAFYGIPRCNLSDLIPKEEN